MRIADSPAVDVRGPLTAQRERLLDLLAGLRDAQWAAPTVAPQWSVKDIALHLIDVDLSWVARNRDHDQAGLIAERSGHREVVQGLARRNQQWVDGARVLSPRLINDLLAWSGEQLDASLSTVDLARPSSVYWAGEAPVWFDLAREFTERWVHYQQIREAVQPAQSSQGTADQLQSPDEHLCSPGQYLLDQDEYLPMVVRTFMWGFPHQYRAPAPAGTAVALEITGVGVWTLIRSASGWTLLEGQPAEPAASLRTTGDAAWRLFTGAPYDLHQVQISGQPALARPLLRVRGIIV